VVFPCYDREGKARGAVLRGTYPDRPFKGMAAGSDSRYPWCWPAEGRKVAVVCESPIDALSLVTLKPALADAHLVGLGGVRGEALLTFLEEYQARTLILALDSDVKGKEAAAKFKAELRGMGYAVPVLHPPDGCGDWNEVLLRELGRR